MESFFGAMSGIGILLAIGYLLLTIFIIVYFFRMANDVRALKESLENITRILIKKNPIDEKINQPESIQNNKETKFQIGDLVVNIKSGKQMRVKEINEDNGKYSCFTNGGLVFEGDFDDSEIKLF